MFLTMLKELISLAALILFVSGFAVLAGAILGAI